MPWTSYGIFAIGKVVDYLVGHSSLRKLSSGYSKEKGVCAMFQPGRYQSDWHLISILELARTTQKWIEQQESTPWAVSMGTLVKSYEEMAVAYYAAAVRQLPGSGAKTFHLHNVIEKLAEEWMLLVPIIQVAAVRPDTPLALLARVVEGASEALNLDLDSQIAVVPHVGRHFELVRFHYAPYVALIGVPFFDLQTPWEWSVIWHELAGILVAQQSVQEMITKFLEQLPDSTWEEWEKRYVPETSEGEAVDVPAVSHRDSATDAGGESIESPINRRGWLEEWVEDACSILALGPAAYQILVTVFQQRHSNLVELKDERHPPPGLRLEVAYRLLTKMAKNDPQARKALKSVKTNHSKAEGDSGAAEIAEWIWANAETLVKSVFDWRTGESDELSDLGQLVRRIVIESRQRILQPDQGKVIWNEAQSLLNDWLLENQVVSLRVVDSEFPKLKSQAKGFIEKIEGKSWEELQELALSETDHVSPKKHRKTKKHPTWITFQAHGRSHWLYHEGH
jgi:hypothetical protein